jgi:DNA-directed RNA polymerase specialized sigma24 family protein
MRRVLIDHARRKHAAKRGGKDATKRPVLTIGGGGPDGPSSFDPVYGVLELSSVLDKLKEIDPQAHRVVMLRYFAGLSEAQTAELIGRSERQVRRIWVGARAWLHERLETEPGR